MSYIGNVPTQAAFVTDTFSGTGSTTAFTMSVAPAGTSSALVVVSGVVQDPTTYSVNGLTLTFSTAPPTGTGNISVRYLGISASGVTTTAYRTVTEFTATAGQTTFTPPSYTVGFINVYRNGVRLGAADYTATNGTTVVLASGATAGDLVSVESFLVSSVLNAIPATAGAVTNDYLLNGSVSQSKLAAGVAGTGPAFSAYQSSAQSVTATVYTKIQFQTEEFDTANCFDTSTYRFQPTVAGYYQVSGSFTVTAANTQVAILVYKNGTNFKSMGSGTTTGDRAGGSCLVYMNGSTDYLELYAYVGATQNLATGVQFTYFQAVLVRSA